jgi:hypothetical protein
VTAASDNETAASAVLHNGIVTITGHRVGIAEITITTDGGMAVLTATVEKPDGAPLGAYQERNGSLVIDPGTFTGELPVLTALPCQGTGSRSTCP